MPWHIADDKISVSHWIKPQDYPFNYVVPNFGDRDVDIEDTEDNIEAAEKKLGHKLYADLFNKTKGGEKKAPEKSEVNDDGEG